MLGCVGLECRRRVERDEPKSRQWRSHSRQQQQQQLFCYSFDTSDDDRQTASSTIKVVFYLVQLEIFEIVVSFSLWIWQLPSSCGLGQLRHSHNLYHSRETDKWKCMQSTDYNHQVIGAKVHIRRSMKSMDETAAHIILFIPFFFDRERESVANGSTIGLLLLYYSLRSFCISLL